MITSTSKVSQWQVAFNELLKNKKQTQKDFYQMLETKNFINNFMNYRHLLNFPVVYYDFVNYNFFTKSNDGELVEGELFTHTFLLTNLSDFDFSNKEKSLFKKFYKEINSTDDYQFKMSEDQIISYLKQVRETIFNRFYKKLSKDIYPGLLKEYMNKINLYEKQKSILNGERPYNFYQYDSYLGALTKLIEKTPDMFYEQYAYVFERVNVKQLFVLLVSLPTQYKNDLYQMLLTDINNNDAYRCFLGKINFKSLFYLKPSEFIDNVFRIATQNDKNEVTTTTDVKTFIIAQFTFLTDLSDIDKEDLLHQIKVINEKLKTVTMKNSFYYFLFQQIHLFIANDF